MRFDLVANSLIRDAVVKKELFIKSGEENRAFIHVDDTARAIVLAVKAHVSLVSGQVFNISAEGQELTLNQLANLAKQVVPDILIHIGNEPPDLSGYRVSCSKAAKVLDFKPHFNLLAGMEEVRDALLKNSYSEPYSEEYSNTELKKKTK
jgi:nucleoside-diphosphate-sugar epimerase